MIQFMLCTFILFHMHLNTELLERDVICCIVYVYIVFID